MQWCRLVAVLTWSCVAGSALTASAAEPQKSPPPATAPDNAALYYQRAFQILPQDRAVFEKVADAPVEQVREVIKPYEAAVPFLRFGAIKPRCDWGSNVSLGPELELPHLNAARVLANWVMLRCQVAAADKRHGDLVEDAAALIAFGRHLGSEPFLISRLVEGGATETAVHSLAGSLPAMPPAVLTELARRLDSLPKANAAGESLRKEAALHADWLQSLMTVDAEKLFNQPDGRLAKLLGEDDVNDQTLSRLQQRWSDPAVRAADIGVVRSAGEAAAAVADAPPPEQAAKLATYQAVRDKSPLAILMLGKDISGFADTVRMTEVRMAMLRAAVAVQLQGEVALQNHPDPVGGRPFGYKKLPDGFELSSQAKHKTKPVQLIVGPAQ